jgi:hypothetical protein
VNQFLAHLFGDYVLQNHWEATQKTTSTLPALSHAAKYTAAFLPVTRNPKALAVIGGTHFVLDRFRLAKQVSWVKNQVGVPKDFQYSWAEGKDNGGYPADTPNWLSTWLMIITDNTIHLTINEWALRRFK